MGRSFTWLKGQRQFQLALAAEWISGIGDWFNSVAVFSLLLQLTGSGVSVGITLALRTFPYLILGPYAGVVVDKVQRRRLLMVCNLCAAVVALTFLTVNTPSRVWVVYAATLGLVTCSAFIVPAKSAIIPQLVPKQHLVSANALLQMVLGSVMAMGAFLGGITTAALGVQVAFLINALSFASAAVLFWFIRMPHRSEREARDTERDPRTGSLKEIWPLLKEVPTFRLVTWMFLLWPIGGGVVNVLLSVYAFQVFHAGNAGVGVMYGCLGVGFIVGGMLSNKFGRWLRLGAVAGYTVEGLGHAVMSQVPTMVLAAVCLIVATVGAGIGDTCIQTMLQQSVPSHALGRVSALLNSAANVLLSLFMMIAGALLNTVAPRHLGLLAGVLIAGSALIFGARLARSELRQPPDEVLSASK